MRKLPPSRSTAASGGATLVEVLMSCMLMGIGVVTLATLFPISILRAAQASQLTNATILKHNAESILDLDPRNVTEPGAFGALVYHNRNYIVDPLGYATYSTMTATNLPIAPSALPPPPPLASIPPAPLNNLNWYDWFGNNGPGNRVPHTATKNLQRCAGLIPPVLFNESMAAAFVTLPDSWIVHFDAIPISINPARTAATLSPSVDLSQVIVRDDLDLSGLIEPWEVNRGAPGADSIASRILLFDSTGRRCETREITSISGNIITWTENVDPLNDATQPPDPGEDFNNNGIVDEHALPADFGTVERVRIVTDDRRYTWMLSVRNRSGVCSVDCVVFFKRPMQGFDEERLYGPAAPPNAFTANSNVVSVSYNPGGGLPRPYLKKGSFIFDPENAYWYRIINYEDDGAIVRVTIDRPAIANSTAAIFMKGIVNVFPMQTRSP